MPRIVDSGKPITRWFRGRGKAHRQKLGYAQFYAHARADAALIKGLVRRTAEDVIEIGNALIRQKKALPGAFHAWIEAEFGWQERLAQRFMSIATKFGNADRSNLTGLSMHALTELAAPSTPPEIREEIERRTAPARSSTRPKPDAVKMLRPYFGGCSSLLSQRITLSVFSGSSLSQSKHRNVRCPLPSGGSAKTRYAPQLGQVGRSAWPMARILPPVATPVK